MRHVDGVDGMPFRALAISVWQKSLCLLPVPPRGLTRGTAQSSTRITLRNGSARLLGYANLLSTVGERRLHG